VLKPGQRVEEACIPAAALDSLNVSSSNMSIDHLGQTGACPLIPLFKCRPISCPQVAEHCQACTQAVPSRAMRHSSSRFRVALLCMGSRCIHMKIHVFYLINFIFTSLFHTYSDTGSKSRKGARCLPRASERHIHKHTRTTSTSSLVALVPPTTQGLLGTINSPTATRPEQRRLSQLRCFSIARTERNGAAPPCADLPPPPPPPVVLPAARMAARPS
jgi:hypothetical protein